CLRPLQPQDPRENKSGCWVGQTIGFCGLPSRALYSASHHSTRRIPRKTNQVAGWGRPSVFVVCHLERYTLPHTTPRAGFQGKQIRLLGGADHRFLWSAISSAILCLTPLHAQDSR